MKLPGKYLELKQCLHGPCIDLHIDVDPDTIPMLVDEAELLEWAKELAETAWFKAMLSVVHQRDFGTKLVDFDDWWAERLKELEGK